jgi:mono/diheme cytochrome c family protein
MTGCGATTTTRESANVDRGKELFQQKCGQCHVLADAGTAGQVGPNLDDGFIARDQGFDESLYFELVLEQMEIPGPPMPDFDEPADKENFLPEDDRVAVAAYVASVARKPVEDTGEDDPKAVFTASCGSCHVLEDAGTTGTTGPNLDESQPGLEEAERQIAEGGGGMPAFRDQLSEDQIRALAEYVVETTGGG